MKSIIGNHNVLIGNFETEEQAKNYIRSQKMCGDECQFEGYYFNCYELVEDGEQGVFSKGIDWNNLKSFDDFKKEKEAAYKKGIESLSQVNEGDPNSYENLIK